MSSPTEGDHLLKLLVARRREDNSITIWLNLFTSCVCNYNLSFVLNLHEVDFSMGVLGKTASNKMKKIKQVGCGGGGICPSSCIEALRNHFILVNKFIRKVIYKSRLPVFVANVI
jgi:hypothetical protein